jgi:phosphomannomutase
MGLLLVEMVASYGVSLSELVDQLLKEVGPAFYERRDIRLGHPVSKEKMVAFLQEEAPTSIGGESLDQVCVMDGVKYIFKDDSWLLIRPSGTEPVLRVYAEGRSDEMVKALLGFGQTLAQKAL